MYKIALLIDQMNKCYFINNWFDATAFTLSPLDILSSLLSVLYGFSLFISYTQLIRVCLTDRHEFVIRAQTPTGPRKCHPRSVSTRIHTWACTANKCDETQIYWRTVTCASRHGLCERVAFEMSDSDLFASFRSMPIILGFSLFSSWPCFFSIIYVILLFLSYISYSIRHIFHYSREVVSFWLRSDTLFSRSFCY